jgi:hypothetical protein
MKNDILLEKYKQINEIAFSLNYKEELERLHDKYVGEGLPDKKALKKAKEELKRKYKVELDEYYPNMGDVDIPDGPL